MNLSRQYARILSKCRLGPEPCMQMHRGRKSHEGKPLFFDHAAVRSVRSEIVEMEQGNEKSS